MKKSKSYFLTTVVLLLFCHTLYGQMQLIKTFEEENIEGYTRFGKSFSNAGDVNNDGYDDIIISGGGKTGNAYIYFGGKDMNDSADVTLFVGKSSTVRSVSNAGDVNNDGFGDVIISVNGKVCIYFGGSEMDTTADVVLTGRSGFGYKLSSAGDINGDGYDDVMVSVVCALRDYETYCFNGVYIYYGGETMDDSADVEFVSEYGDVRIGRTFSGVNDLNNDGFDDVIVSYHNSVTHEDKAYIYFGGETMDDSIDVILNGTLVSAAGDVNNDGYFDVMVMKYRKPYTYVYFGGTIMDDSVDVILSHNGSSLSTVGDINNDGYDDVIVSKYYYNNERGKAYIYYGGANMDSVADHTVEGEFEGSYFGSSVSLVGDVNNDGYDDILIGAYRYKHHGKVYLYSDPDAPVSVKKEINIAEEFALFQNYPNPFNPKTIINYELSVSNFVNLSIYTALGEKVITLVDGNKQSGKHHVVWDASSFASGIYFYRLKTSSGFIQTKKLILLK